MVDAGKTQVSVGQALQPAHDLVSAHGAVLEVAEQPVQGSFVHTCPWCHGFGGSPVPLLAGKPAQPKRPAPGAMRLTGCQALVSPGAKTVAQDANQALRRTAAAVLVDGHAGAHNQGRHIGAVDVEAHSAGRLGAFRQELRSRLEPLLDAGSEFLALDAGPGQLVLRSFFLTARSTSSAMKVNMAARGHPKYTVPRLVRPAPRAGPRRWPRREPALVGK